LSLLLARCHLFLLASLSASQLLAQKKGPKKRARCHNRPGMQRGNAQSNSLYVAVYFMIVWWPHYRQLLQVLYFLLHEHGSLVFLFGKK
jgi:hypothetical protein